MKEIEKNGGSTPKTVQDARRALDDQNLDAISIATPNDRHADEAVAAARAGKHLVLEKPTGLDEAELVRIRDAVRAFEWFLGRNRLRLAVYDFSTGGCHDGLGESAVNDNEGAESTLAYLQALLALDAAGLQATLPG